eukprot:TRINITY_DN1452_c0_g1_i1.p1 TRINITY_DN1452_c0_g1~~TRINITY_DN1452_c0_g1_i1.p1  ORF type:complete len:212 (-),score=52.44 TRINITY_DN1452_c0_g1_i1:236-832(-)
MATTTPLPLQRIPSKPEPVVNPVRNILVELATGFFVGGFHGAFDTYMASPVHEQGVMQKPPGFEGMRKILSRRIFLWTTVYGSMAFVWESFIARKSNRYAPDGARSLTTGAVGGFLFGSILKVPVATAIQVTALGAVTCYVLTVPFTSGWSNRTRSAQIRKELDWEVYQRYKHETEKIKQRQDVELLDLEREAIAEIL